METRKADLETAAAAILDAVQAPVQGAPFLIAIDGRCASGKTTLAGSLCAKTGWEAAHMDDFFPRPEQRTPERLAQPGGNSDRERFLSEVLLPLRQGQEAVYRPYDCHTQGFRETVRLKPGPAMVIEGSYCCHPALWDQYDLHVFLDVPPGEQLRRILGRNGADGLRMFREKWIPLEEAYFQAFQIREACELCFEL